MAGTDPHSSVISNLPGGLSMETLASYSTEVSNEVIGEFTLIDQLTKKGRTVYGSEEPSHVWDKEVEMEASGLLPFGYETDIVASGFVSQRRLEMKYQNFYVAVPLSGFVKTEQGSGKNRLRDHNKTRVTNKRDLLASLIEDTFMSGDGEEYVFDGAQQQRVAGVATAIQTTPAGLYGGMSRSGNDFLQNQSLNMDSGGAFASNAFDRIDTLDGACTVSLNRKRMGPDFSIADETTLSILRRSAADAIQINVQGGGMDPNSPPKHGFKPRTSIMVNGVVTEWCSACPSKTIFRLNSKSILIKSRYPKLINVAERVNPTTVTNNRVLVMFGSVLMVFDYLRANGVGTYS